MVDDVAREFSGQGLIVLAVDVLEPDAKVKKYLAAHPRSVPIVLTKDRPTCCYRICDLEISEHFAKIFVTPFPEGSVWTLLSVQSANSL
jgi:hypothetical protein